MTQVSSDHIKGKSFRRSSNFTLNMIFTRIGSFKKLFQKFFIQFFWMTLNFVRDLDEFFNFEAKYLQIGVKFWQAVYRVCFVAVLSHFWPSFIKIFPLDAEILTEDHSKNAWKLAIIVVKFHPEDQMLWKNGWQQSEKNLP